MDAEEVQGRGRTPARPGQQKRRQVRASAQPVHLRREPAEPDQLGVLCRQRQRHHHGSRRADLRVRQRRHHGPQDLPVSATPTSFRSRHQSRRTASWCRRIPCGRRPWATKPPLRRTPRKKSSTWPTARSSGLRSRRSAAAIPCAGPSTGPVRRTSSSPQSFCPTIPTRRRWSRCTT